MYKRPSTSKAEPTQAPQGVKIPITPIPEVPQQQVQREDSSLQGINFEVPLQQSPTKLSYREDSSLQGINFETPLQQSPTQLSHREDSSLQGISVETPPQQSPTKLASINNSLPLVRRYIADQHTQLHPAQQAPAQHKDAPRDQLPTQQIPVQSQKTGGSAQQMQHIEQIVRVSTPPPSSIADMPTSYIPATPKPQIDSTTQMDESNIAASKAAEHWRKSWRDRQRAEAGPAVGISRGQASVPEPLMAMQHSLARMRAIILPQSKTAQQNRNTTFGFWVTVVMMICLIGGLSAYIISTYIPNTQNSSQLISSLGAPQPTLAVQGAKAATLLAGQTLKIHGEQFIPNHTITFILDVTPLYDANGRQLSVQSNNHGAFDVTIPIAATQLAGTYALQAQDNRAGQHAFLDIQILPGTATVNNTTLALTMQGKPLTNLAFTAVVGNNAPDEQLFTLNNTDVTPLQWTAVATADNNQNWLLIDNGQTSGTLLGQNTDIIGVSINPTGLKSSAKPYIGHVIFTVNQKDQVILPVSLQVRDTAIEVVVNPNPIIAILQPGGAGTCQPTTLTLINLSNVVVTWAANPYAADQAHIHLDGQPTTQGTLQPSGAAQSQDIKVLHISCLNAQPGEKLYHITVSYNLNNGGNSQDVPVSIRTN